MHIFPKTLIPLSSAFKDVTRTLPTYGGYIRKQGKYVSLNMTCFGFTLCFVLLCSCTAQLSSETAVRAGPHCTVSYCTLTYLTNCIILPSLYSAKAIQPDEIMSYFSILAPTWQCRRTKHLRILSSLPLGRI